MKKLIDRSAEVWRTRGPIIKMMSFGSIGVLNIFVDVVVFTTAFELLGLPLIASNVISWVVAVSGSYAMNSKITFGRETGGILKRTDYLRFVASGVFGLVVGTTALVICSRYTNIAAAKCISILAAFFVNFCLSHFVVFGGQRESDLAN